MHEINQWILQQASPGGAGRGSVAVADTRAAVAAPDSPDRLFASPDGLHPTPAGYRRMADAIRPVLERVLTAR
jgi:lysophospholipase L1-like esterase